MSTTVERDVTSVDPAEMIKREIDLSREGHRPISRQLLADMLSIRLSMKMDRAWVIVDQYCDEHEAAIPSYLSQEFNMHWPKVVSVLLGIAALVVGWLGITTKGVSWPFFAGATVILGLAALMFVHSLESFQKFQRERREQLKH
jgi:hypothetical protein